MNELDDLRAEVARLRQDIDECWVPLYHATKAERDAAEAKVARVEALLERNSPMYALGEIRAALAGDA